MLASPHHTRCLLLAAQLALALQCVGCASASRPSSDQHVVNGAVLPVFTASDALVSDWQNVKVWGKSDWRLVAVDNEVAIEALVDGSSTALARWIDIDTRLCPLIEWAWRVDALPEGANLASRDSEDVAASVLFVFGDPGTFSNPKPVPTVRYVWSTSADPFGSVIESPYLPKTLRSIVVRSGKEDVGKWVTERRNLRADYAAAFGKEPPGPIRAVALYSDNDHLKRPARALYSQARALCIAPQEEG